jgi:carbonic anhydrase/acetyltransferase-like protein (isoleucine patch superfamily)
MSISAFGDKVPQFDPGVFVHPDATIIGDVVLEVGVTVWPGAVLRGDIERISVAAETSLQDGVVIHTEPGSPVVIGRGCAVGHCSIVHGAAIGDGSLIGMHATLLDGAEIGAQSIVGANALVLGRRAYPRRALLIGTPARMARELTDEEVERITWVRGRYSARGKLYTEQGLAADLSAFRR